MIEKTEAQFEHIKKATCDSCGENIPLNVVGQLPDHVKIGGHHEGKLLEAIVCIKCMEDKLSFIKIQSRENIIGYC
ncbi:MAG: hypothetical protein AABY15_02855 [Nanoarchaeota archaeon]